ITRRAHAPSHIRIDGKPFRLNQDLTGPGILHGLRVHDPIVGDGHAFRIAGEKPSTVDQVLLHLVGSFYSARMLPAAITLRHFSVSSATSLTNSALDNDSGLSPRSAIRPVIIASPNARLVVLLSCSTVADGVSRGAAIPT